MKVNCETLSTISVLIDCYGKVLISWRHSLNLKNTTKSDFKKYLLVTP